MFCMLCIIFHVILNISSHNISSPPTTQTSITPPTTTLQQQSTPPPPTTTPKRHPTTNNTPPRNPPPTIHHHQQHSTTQRCRRVACGLLTGASTRQFSSGPKCSTNKTSLTSSKSTFLPSIHTPLILLPHCFEITSLF